MGTYTYQTKRCPKCGSVYEKHTVRGPYGSEKLYKFGPIFVRCTKCGAVFRDSYSYELAIMDPPKEMTKKFHLSNIVISSILILMGFVCLFVGDIANPFGLLLFCLVFAGGIMLGDYRRYRDNCTRIETERKLSEKRLKQQPEYALLLKSAGFTVPEEYLPKSKSFQKK